jgi:hypothetical protein
MKVGPTLKKIRTGPSRLSIKTKVLTYGHYLPAVSFWLLERWCQSIPPGRVEIHRWIFAVYACASASFSSSNCESGFWFLISTVCFLKYKFFKWHFFKKIHINISVSRSIPQFLPKNTAIALDMGKLEYRRDSNVSQTNTFLIDPESDLLLHRSEDLYPAYKLSKMWSAFSISSILPSLYKALANLSQGFSIFCYFCYEGELAVSIRRKKDS